MTIIFEDIIINMDNVLSVCVCNNSLAFDSDNSVINITGYASNALQQIAVALAEGKPYIELEGRVILDPSIGSSGDTNDGSEFDID